MGTEAAGQTFNPGTFDTTEHRRVGGRSDHPEQAVLLRELREPERQAAADDVHVESRRRAGDRQHHARARVGSRRRSARLLSSKFNYQTGPFDGITKETPGKPFLVKGDYNINSNNKCQLPVQPAQLEHRRVPLQLVVARVRPADLQHELPELPGLRTTTILENIKSGIGEWNSVARQLDVEQPDHRLHEAGREPRTARQALPVRRHPAGRQRLHVDRQRAVHAGEPAPLQHLPGAGQLHEVQRPPDA